MYNIKKVETIKDFSFTRQLSNVHGVTLDRVQPPKRKCAGIYPFIWRKKDIQK